jgi:hypothetical protein
MVSVIRRVGQQATVIAGVGRESTVARSDSCSLGDVTQKGVDGGNGLTVSASQTCEEFRSDTPEVGRNSAVGIATRYGLDGPGIESRWGARFSAPIQTGPGAHPASYRVSFPWIKRPGRGVAHPPHSNDEV